MAHDGVRAFLGIGSNLQPQENIARALRLLKDTPGVRILGISTFYRTSPLPSPGRPSSSVAQDPDFLNGVVEIRTALSPPEVIHLLGQIEETLGRVRSQDRYAPRTMDLDLLLLVPPEGPEAPLVRDEADAPAPHPDIRKRPFVAIPLLELDPTLLIPPDAEPLAGIAGAFRGDWGTPEEAFTRELRKEHLATDRIGLPADPS